MKETYWKYSLIILIVGLGILLFRQAQPYMNGILGGFTLYLLLRGFTNWMKTKIKPLAAVWIVTIGTTLFILIPLSLFSWALVNQISNLHFDTADIIRPAQQMIGIIEERTGFDVLSEKNLSFVITQVSSIGHSIMTGVSDLIINLAVAIMLLFFMLWEGDKMEQFISELLPFEENNKREVLQKIQLIVRSNAIGIPLLAIIQGIISLPAFGNHPGHHLPFRIPALRSAEPRPYSHAHRLRVDYPHCRDGIGMAPGYGLFLSHGRLDTRADTFRLRQPHRCPMR